MRMSESIFADRITETTPPHEARRGICDGYEYEHIGEINGINYGWRFDLCCEDGTPQYVYLNLPSTFTPKQNAYDLIMIARTLRTSPIDLQTILTHFAIAGQLDTQTSTRYYSNLSLELLRDECTWQNWFADLPRTLAAYSIGKSLGKSVNGVNGLAKVLDYTPDANNRFDKNLLHTSRTHIRSHKKQESCISSEEMSHNLGHRNPKWAKNALCDIGIEPDIRWNKRGLLAEMFDIKYQETLESSWPKAAGEAWSRHMIAITVFERTGFSRHWTYARLDALQAYRLLNDDGRPCLHYMDGEKIANHLIKIAEDIKAQATDVKRSYFVSLDSACEIFGTSDRIRVKSFLLRHSESKKLEMSRGSDGRRAIAYRYDPTELEALKPEYAMMIKNNRSGKTAASKDTAVEVI
ncbi:hypothetical protein FWC31_02660 [Candidatus Saccharibacteria bacterium]|nr:hypothetical protein [Candidatus Saccharibacteria bacterium]